MRKPAKRTQEPDINQLADHQIRMMAEKLESAAQPTTEQISRVMAALGRKGGKVGGVARASRLSDARKKEIAAMGAKKRWENSHKSDNI